jgi:putative oxygen-independent coproporphyrinogen III oxidase
MTEDLAIYIHVPFCVRKCAYCDFNAYSGLGHLAAPYVDAVCEEIRRSEAAGRNVGTIFFGGGTPTFLLAADLARIVSAVRDTFQVLPNAEITAEANPSTIDAERFAEIRAAGFNRLSIGVQAFDDRLLKAVDREHSADEAEAAFRAARQACFDTVSIDLMFGLPGQTRDDWDRTLDRALSLAPEHLSIYALTIEPGTRFERLHAGGKLSLTAEEDDLWMFERAIERLTAAGYEHYEVSNYALPGWRAQHNLVYWANGEYAGFGPGAVSYLRGRRWTNEKNPGRYIARVRESGSLVVDTECVGREVALAETLMLGLRLREGIAPAPLSRRFGIDPLEHYAVTFARLEARGLLEVLPDRLRLTHAGLLLANDVFLELLP